MNHETPSDADNPYRSPVEVADYALPQPPVDLRIERMRLNYQMLALGLSWIAIGLFEYMVLFILSSMIVTLSRNQSSWSGVRVGSCCLVVSAFTLILGLLTCLRRIWALYLNLAISYLTVIFLLGVLVEGVPVAQVAAFFSLLIFTAVSRRAHKVIGIAQRLHQQELLVQRVING